MNGVQKGKNPLSVLGLNRELLRTLNDDQIMSLAKSQYKALQTIFHPDVASGGNVRRSVEVNLAYDSIQNNAEFKHFKEKLLRSGKRDALEEKDRQIETMRMGMNALSDNFIGYLVHAARLGHHLSVFSPGPFSLKMVDSITASLGDCYSYAYGNKGDENFFTMSVEEDRSIKKSSHGSQREQHYKEKRLIGSMDYNTGNKMRLLSYFKKAAGVERGLAAANFYESELIKPPEGETSALNELPLPKLEPLLPYLTPIIKEYMYLFAINRRDEEHYISLEGMVVPEKSWLSHQASMRLKRT